MKSKKPIITLFLLLAIIQLIAPAKMIYDQEITIANGKPYKFIIQPIDPNDPFRGKYISMNYKMDSYNTSIKHWNRNQEIYVYISDSLGFAKLDTITKERLNVDKDFIKAKVSWYNKNSEILNFNILNERFYMEETKAKPAEDVVREIQNDTLNTNVTYALISIKDDISVLQDVFINDESIQKILDVKK